MNITVFDFKPDVQVFHGWRQSFLGFFHRTCTFLGLSTLMSIHFLLFQRNLWLWSCSSFFCVSSLVSVEPIVYGIPSIVCSGWLRCQSSVFCNCKYNIIICGQDTRAWIFATAKHIHYQLSKYGGKAKKVVFLPDTLPLLVARPDRNFSFLLLFLLTFCPVHALHHLGQQLFGPVTLVCGRVTVVGWGEVLTLSVRLCTSIFWKYDQLEQ